MSNSDNSESIRWANYNEMRPIEEIPAPYRSVFGEYAAFNRIQSKIFDDVFHTDKSLVISAPTGAGKTGIFELAIVKLLSSGNSKISSSKIIYITPMKALCEERLVDWHKKFNDFGLNCISVTGDSDIVDIKCLVNHNLIITTPEKWDSLTRRWKDNTNLVEHIRLFMIDEIHLLHEERRGPTLETVVCRMKTIEQQSDTANEIRYIAASATIVNAEDIAEWLQKSDNVNYYKFSDDYRPVKLNTIILGYPYYAKCTPFKFDLALNYKLKGLIMEYSHGKPTLIFCSTRKIVEMTSKYILQNLTINLKPEQVQRLKEVGQSISDVVLSESLIHGIGYHHAGILPHTRNMIETLFRNSELPILVTTSTLAMGVNLPAHLVIVKSTKCYRNGEYRDYTETAIMQMIGRAGRPQFDTTATALILTTTKDKEKFEKMVGALQPIESNLHQHLSEHLNAEIVLGTITDIHVAMQWLSSTFLYVRAKKNPRYYGLSGSMTPEQIDRKLLEMCQIELNKLVKARILDIDQGIILTPTTTGELMAKYYLSFDTMKLFTELNGGEILQQILGLISRCYEFSEMYLRVNDKKCLNLLNRCRNAETIRFPLLGKIKTLEMKINCIIQAVLGCLDIYEQSLLCDTLKILRNGERIAKCLIEYLESREKCYQALLSTIILAKCLKVNLWENSPYVSKQLSGIGKILSTQLVQGGKDSFSALAQCDPREIELLLNKKPPLGNNIVHQVQHLPKYTLKIKHQQGTCDVIIALDNAVDLIDHCTVNQNSIMYLLIGDSSNNILCYEKYAHSYFLENPEVVKLIKIQSENLEQIEAHLISEDWVGFDCNVKLNLRKPKENIPKIVQNNKRKVNQDKKTTSEDLTYMQMFMKTYMKYKKPTEVKENIRVQDRKLEQENPINDKIKIHSDIRILKYDDLATERTNRNVLADISNKISSQINQSGSTVDQNVDIFNSKKTSLYEDLEKNETVHYDESEKIMSEQEYYSNLEVINITDTNTNRSEHQFSNLGDSRNGKSPRREPQNSVKMYDKINTRPFNSVSRNVKTIFPTQQQNPIAMNFQPPLRTVSTLEYCNQKQKTHQENKNLLEQMPEAELSIEYQSQLEKFRYTPKLLKHTETIQSQSREFCSEEKFSQKKIPNNESGNRRITWRSPLTYSPTMKFSPKNITQEISSMKSAKRQSSTSIHPPTQAKTSKYFPNFPLSDIACGISSAEANKKTFREAINDLTDIVSSSFFETVLGVTLENKKGEEDTNKRTKYVAEYYSQLCVKPKQRQTESRELSTNEYFRLTNVTEDIAAQCSEESLEITKQISIDDLSLDSSINDEKLSPIFNYNNESHESSIIEREKSIHLSQSTNVSIVGEDEPESFDISRPNSDYLQIEPSYDVPMETLDEYSFHNTDEQLYDNANFQNAISRNLNTIPLQVIPSTDIYLREQQKWARNTLPMHNIQRPNYHNSFIRYNRHMYSYIPEVHQQEYSARDYVAIPMSTPPERSYGCVRRTMESPFNFGNYQNYMNMENATMTSGYETLHSNDLNYQGMQRPPFYCDNNSQPILYNVPIRFQSDSEIHNNYLPLNRSQFTAPNIVFNNKPF